MYQIHFTAKMKKDVKRMKRRGGEETVLDFQDVDRQLVVGLAKLM